MASPSPDPSASPPIHRRRRRRRRVRPSSGRRIAPAAALGVPALVALAIAATIPGPIFRADLLHALSNPNYDLPLLLVGILLIYLECNRPGTVLPAALGTLCTMLALFGLSQLTLNPVALVAILLAFALLGLEFFFNARNFLAAFAAAVLAFGLARLMHTPVGAPQSHLAVHPAVALLVAFLFVLVTVPLVRIALQARRNKRIQTVTDPLPVRRPSRRAPGVD